MTGQVHAPKAELDSADIEAIERVVREYWDSWYAADREALGAILHPDFELRALTHRILDTRPGYVAVDKVTQSELVYLCGAIGGSDVEEPLNEVTVLAATHYVASARAVGEGQEPLGRCRDGRFHHLGVPAAHTR